ncbi:MAG: FAD-binding oxidoreductase, partial [Candidatus Thorarchaeota archaeon]
MANRIEAQAPPAADISQVKAVRDPSEIADTYALYLDDESHSFDGRADEILFPTTEGELAALLKQAHAKNVPVTIQGSRTGLTGAAVPLGGIVINVERMNRLLYVDYEESRGVYTIAAEPGVLLEDLVRAVTTKSLDEL